MHTRALTFENFFQVLISAWASTADCFFTRALTYENFSFSLKKQKGTDFRVGVYGTLAHLSPKRCRGTRATRCSRGGIYKHTHTLYIITLGH